MKYMTKLAFFALLAAVALGACDTGLAPVSPDFTEVHKSYSVSGTNAIADGHFPTITTPNPLGGNYYIIVDGDNADTIVIVEFPTVVGNGDNTKLYLDAFEGNPDNAALATRLQSFLSFYNVAKRTTADPTTANPPAAQITPYTVVKRENYKVWLKLPATAANKGYVQWKIDGSKYTYRGGNTFDVDGNGVAEEPFYDDKYGTFAAVDKNGDYTSATYAGSLDEIFYQAPLDGVNNAGSISVNISPTGAWGVAGREYTITAIVTADDNSKATVDYTADVKSHIRLETYANSAYTPVDLTWSRAGTTSNQYKAIVTVPHKSIYRIRAKNGIVSKTKVGGAVQRIWFSGGDETISKNADVWGTYKNAKEYYNDTDKTTFNQVASGKFWSTIVVNADMDGRNVSVVYNLDNTSFIGKQGLNTTILEGSIKLGYFAVENNTTTKKVVLLPTKKIELRYSGLNNKAISDAFRIPDPDAPLDATKAKEYIKDQLVIELAETVDKDEVSALSSTDNLVLFITFTYGFRGDAGPTPAKPSGTFGNYANIAWTVDGVYHYGEYKGSDTNTGGRDPVVTKPTSP